MYVRPTATSVTADTGPVTICYETKKKEMKELQPVTNE